MDNAIYTNGLGSARYIVVGNGLDFLPIISFYRGLRLVAEKKVMRLGTEPLITIPYGGCEVTNALQKVDKFLVRPCGKKWDGLFLSTSWYKETVLVGCAETGSRMFFFKVFKHQSIANQEAARMKIIRDLYERWFEIPRVEGVHGRLLVLSYLPRLEWLPPREGRQLLKKALIEMPENSEQQYASLEKLINSMSYRMDSFNKAGVSKSKAMQILEKIKNALRPHIDSYPIQLAHGDMTPWNSYRTTDGRMALVDSERAGFRVRYTDFLHYHAQPRAIARFSFQSPMDYVSELCRSFSLPMNSAVTIVCLYLAEEMVIDLGEIDQGRVSRTLCRAFRRRCSWLESILGSTKNPDMGLAQEGQWEL
ncbi:MAG: hypothetical protein KJ804_10955 [Proteobacteria bacterium]|nr:hypothetical protein [Pseudomonadota bacterium]MBU1058823.1 hypothetical protein [Pseudomonadota bacterium]